MTTALEKQINLLKELAVHPDSARLYLMVRPPGMSQVLFVQKVLTQKKAVLSPAVPAELSGMTAPLDGLLALLTASGSELCLVFAQHLFAAGPGEVVVQRGCNDCVELLLISVTSLQQGDVIHDTQIYGPESYRLAQIVAGPEGRLGHVAIGGGDICLPT